MNYVVYADVMFLWIFLINFLTYYITCKIVNYDTGKLKLVLWSIFSALILVAFYIMVVHQKPLIYNSLYVILNILLMGIFIRCILKVKRAQGFLKLLAYNMIGTFLLAGVLQIFVGQSISLRKMLPVIIIICLIIPLIHNFLPVNHKESAKLLSLMLCTRHHSIGATGYMDTGNTLKDTYSGRPVIIIDSALILDLLDIPELSQLEKYQNTGNYEHISQLVIDGEKIFPLPYKTISNSFSILPCFKLRRLVIDHTTHENIVAGISQKCITAGKEYNVLLNNNL